VGGAACAAGGRATARCPRRPDPGAGRIHRAHGGTGALGRGCRGGGRRLHGGLGRRGHAVPLARAGDDHRRRQRRARHLHRRRAAGHGARPGAAGMAHERLARLAVDRRRHRQRRRLGRRPRRRGLAGAHGLRHRLRRRPRGAALMAGEITISQAAAVLRQAMRDTMRRRSLIYLVHGAVLVVAGIAAIVSPLFAALGLIALLGWLLVAVGISEAVGLFGARHVPYFWLQAVSAVLAVAVGWGLIVWPEAGLIATALLMVVFLTVQGIGRVVFGLMLRPMEDWGWLVASGVLGVVLGVLLAA